MIVQPLSTTPASTPAAGTTSSQNSSPDNVSENQFLQLLVAQLQYQDPTSPTDSTQFVTQLAQFSSLEQLISIHGDLDTLNASVTSTSTTQGG
jgi:flagellar basal-body rod modification protein FlgD